MTLIDADKLLEKSYFSGEIATVDNLYPEGEDVVSVKDIEKAEPYLIKRTYIFVKNNSIDCFRCGNSIEFSNKDEINKIKFCPCCGAEILEVLKND